MPDNIYVPSGETVIVNAQVDCLFVTGMGKAFGSTEPVDIAVEKFIPIKFIEDTHLLSKQLGLTGSEKNLLDQALVVNMVEETFGSEAATGLAGEVSKAIN